MFVYPSAVNGTLWFIVVIKASDMSFSSVLLNMQLAYEVFVMWLVMNWRTALSSIFLILLLVAGGFGYQAYRDVCAIKAHRAYADVMRVVNAPVATQKKQHNSVSFESEQEKNAAIVAAADAFVSKHSSSGFAATVHGFAARALAEAGKLEQARDRMHQAAKASSNNELKDLYALSAALMDLDSGEARVEAGGLSSLKDLAHNHSSSICDAALYRLGEFYWNQKNYQEARLAWGQLIAIADNKTTPMKTDIRSPWVKAAHEKLALIDYK